VTTRVQIHTDAAAKGPDIDRNDDGNISAEIIHGRPFAPKLQLASLNGQCSVPGKVKYVNLPPNIIIMAVAALPPAIVESDIG
jgi:hypothetical protein